ncbi:MAG: hypothetical protein QN178_04705 [Armatimonadota bacterium]|nr:hypothetical protein [Armatimonadota bacterium]
MHTRAVPYYVEVELTLANKSQGRLRLDPARFTLMPEQGNSISAAARDDVVYTLRTATASYASVYGVFQSGSFGVAVGLGPFDLQSRAIESRLLRAGDLAPGASVRGSVYFRPTAWPARFSVVLDGLTTEVGTPLPPVEVRNCQMSFRPAEPPVGFAPLPPGLQAFPVSARAETGPIAVSVSRAEFIKDATTLIVTVENTAATPAELFMAIADARLTDGTGVTYAVRVMRSDLPNRVEARGQARGRLVFEPLPYPPAVTSARLTLPGIRTGGVLYDVDVALRF